MDRPHFYQLNRALLTGLQANPKVLKEKKPDHLAKLQSQGREDSQGTGNKVTEQEAAFAAFLEVSGFTFLAKTKKNAHLTTLPKEGLYYIYQANGSQASIDFQTLLVKDSIIAASVSYDLKHTISKSFYLNDGWFHSNVIYVVTWCPKKGELSTFIGMGQDIPTEAENTFMEQLLTLKRTTNETNKKIDSLRPYVRFANQYSCAKFTEEYTRDLLEKTLAFLI
jgi:hypothetical protein